MVTCTRKSWTSLKFTFTRVKITRQWKITVRVDFHCRVIFPCVNNEIEAMYERPRVNVKGERGSTFTFMHDSSIHCPYFIYPRKIYVPTHVKITCQWKSTLRNVTLTGPV